jgi:hypothetical protein
VEAPANESRSSIDIRSTRPVAATIESMTTREKLHRIVDQLPEEELDAALEAIEGRTDDPMIRRLDDAPPEDEEISAEEEAAVREARDEVAAGAPLVSQEEIKREFGIE